MTTNYSIHIKEMNKIT